MPNFDFDPSSDTIENILLRRGVEVAGFGDVSKVLYPFDHFEPPTTSEDRARLLTAKPTYYQYFGNPRFRKVVNQLIKAGANGGLVEQLRVTAGGRVEDYVRLLSEELRVATAVDNIVVLTRKISDLGASLEEYVAYLCEQELRGRAKWGVELKGLPSGGDFDVLAWLAPNLVYVECKSGNSQKINASQLRNFVLRHRELGADLSILLVDTDSPISDVVDRLNVQIQQDYRTNDDVYDAYPIRRRGVQFMIDFDEMRVMPSSMYSSIYFGYHRIYVIGNEPSILTQLRRCLMHHHAYMKQFDLLIAKSFAG
jgi:hypothetical protein